MMDTGRLISLFVVITCIASSKAEVLHFKNFTRKPVILKSLKAKGKQVELNLEINSDQTADIDLSQYFSQDLIKDGCSYRVSQEKDSVECFWRPGKKPGRGIDPLSIGVHREPDRRLGMVLACGAFYFK
jgi:hypothetical protein